MITQEIARLPGNRNSSMTVYIDINEDGSLMSRLTISFMQSPTEEKKVFEITGDSVVRFKQAILGGHQNFTDGNQGFSLICCHEDTIAFSFDNGSFESFNEKSLYDFLTYLTLTPTKEVEHVTLRLFH